MLVMVRHGHTGFNKTSGEKIRGWLPIALNRVGMEDAIRVADCVKNLKLDGIDCVYTSDLPRAVQTAQEIASTLGIEIEPIKDLRDWNVGKFTGTNVSDSLTAIQGYMKNFNKPIPSGESYKEFYNRAIGFLKKNVEKNSTTLAVSHNRILTLLNALCVNDGKYPDNTILKNKGPVNPGGILIVHPDWSTTKINDKGRQDG
jgi:broad specificity phosphatase PhoE